MTKWLKRIVLAIRSTKRHGLKWILLSQQEAFIASYFTLLESALKNESIVLWIQPIERWAPNFVVWGWIRKGKDKPLVKTGEKRQVWVPLN